MTAHILGIDPGLDGGLVWLAPDGEVRATIIMPTVRVTKTKRMLDGRALIALMRQWAPETQHAWVERSAAFPRNKDGSGAAGAASAWTMGYMACAVEMALIAADVPYTLTAPHQWTKAMHAGVSADTPKKRSQIAVQRLYPGIDLRASERARKQHEGLVDALLIASYGHRQTGARA